MNKIILLLCIFASFLCNGQALSITGQTGNYVIKPGIYSSITITGNTNLSISESGPVTFSGTVNVGNNSTLTFDLTNITWTGTGNAFHPAAANNLNYLLKNGNFVGSKISAVLDGSGNTVTYAGTPATFLFYNPTLYNMQLGGSTMLFNGTWEAQLSLHNVVYGFVGRKISINGTTGTAQRILGFSFYHWLIDSSTFTIPATGSQDVGVIQVQGAGRLTNSTFYGGWGYALRDLSVSLDGPDSTVMSNCLIVNHSNYGGVDIRVDNPGSGTYSTGTTNGHVMTGAPFRGVNLTAGNNANAIGYTSSMMVYYGMTGQDGKTVTASFDYCFAYNNTLQNSSNTQLVSLEGTGAPIQGSHNIALTGSTTAYINPTTYLPVTGSPLLTSSGQIGYLGMTAAPNPPIPPIPPVCPVCPTCPPPVVCPVCPAPIVCPVIPPARTVIRWTYDSATGVWTFYFSDGTTQTN